jgi:probable HAF family extracellular repeat protein
MPSPLRLAAAAAAIAVLLDAMPARCSAVFDPVTRTWNDPATPPNAIRTYTMVWLGNINGAGNDINNRNQITGATSMGSGSDAYVWDNGLPITLVLDAAGVGINQHGQVTGWMTDVGGVRAFTWDPTSYLTYSIGDESDGTAINASGRFTGTLALYSDRTVLHAFVSDVGGTPLDITAPDVLAVSHDINDLGEMVGFHAVNFGNSAAVPTLWDGSLRALPILGGHTHSEALALNERGDVVGFAATDLGQRWEVREAFRSNRVTTVALANLSTGTYTQASDINESGEVVGFSGTNSGSYRAVLWDADGVIHDLGVPATRAEAFAINDCGRIVGWAEGLGDFLLVPDALNVDQLRDSDGDGLFDHWEICGVDADGNGTIDLELPGANWQHKDLYVEVDAMAMRAPSPAALARVTAAFAAVPNAGFAFPNPDGQDGITLHINLDETHLALEDWTNRLLGPWDPFNMAKEGHAGTATQRASPHWMAIKEALKRTHRYALFVDAFDGSTSGKAEIGGNDFFVSLGQWSPPGGTEDNQATTFMHELGHTLGLLHGGSEDENFKPNYHSIMNYTWQSPHPRASPRRLDFSHGLLADIDEGQLCETCGLQGTFGAELIVPYRNGAGGLSLATFGQPTDFDGDGQLVALAAADINHVRPQDPASPSGIYRDQNDWAVLDFYFRDSADYQDGANLQAGEQELTLEDVALLATAGLPLDAGSVDAGAADSGVVDSGSTDSGGADASQVMPLDGGRLDGSPVDAAPTGLDASTTQDGSTPDAASSGMDASARSDSSASQPITPPSSGGGPACSCTAANSTPGLWPLLAGALGLRRTRRRQTTA